MSTLLMLEILSWVGLVLLMAALAVMVFALATGRMNWIPPLLEAAVLIGAFESWSVRRRNELKKTSCKTLPPSE